MEISILDKDPIGFYFSNMDFIWLSIGDIVLILH